MTTSVVNKKARFDYEILEKIEAGIVLTGPEVKSIRNGKVSITDCFAKIKKGELYITGMNISLYKMSGYVEQDPLRDKKLLLHKKEIIKIATRINEKGLTVVPLALYFKDNRVKIELGIAKGKKNHDRREDLKKKAIERAEGRRFVR